MADEVDPAFEPPIKAVKLDPQIRARRVAWDSQEGPLNAGWSTNAAPRIQTCHEVVCSLAAYHAQVVDGTGIDLEAETRWVAILESTSRCIGLADALIDQLRQGYASETAGTARVLHEALDLAVALATGDEAQAKLWLQGKQYPTKAAQLERTAFFARLIDESERSAELEAATTGHVAAIEAETGRTVRNAVEAIHAVAGRSYGSLSAGAHNRRESFSDSVSRGLRRFTYGRHPDPYIRSHWIEVGENLIEQACLDVPAALAEIVGVDAVRESALELVRRIQVARTAYPLG